MSQSLLLIPSSGCTTQTSTANIDRRAAIWQDLNEDNPNNWFDTKLPDDGTWGIKQTDAVKSQTPLPPFHKDTAGTYFTSDDVRDWTKWGYTYPEVQRWNYTTKADYQASIKARLRQLCQRLQWDAYAREFIVNV